MVIRVLSHDDPGLKPLKDDLSSYTKRLDALGIPYWFFLEGSDPVGLVSISEEPVMLLEPPGTPLSIIRVIDPERSMETLEEFATKALTLSKDKEVDYSFISLPSRYNELVSQFENLGYKELADTYSMVCQLHGPYEPSEELRFERVERDWMDQFIDLAIDFMSGSPDIVLTMMLENLRDVKGKLLDIWYKMEEFFNVYKDEEVIGILDLNAHDGVVSNIGVAPQQRGKGYGRQIMLFGLKKLKEEGCKKASLRVHIDNIPAKNLYDSLGFTVTQRIKHLIWRKSSRNAHAS